MSIKKTAILNFLPTIFTRINSRQIETKIYSITILPLAQLAVSKSAFRYKKICLHIYMYPPSFSKNISNNHM